MTKATWLILGATSSIAQEFAHLVAKEGHDMFLVGRNIKEIERIANDLRIRYTITCQAFFSDFENDITPLLQLIIEQREFSLFIAHSLILENRQLNQNNIQSMITINILSTVQIIHAYLSKPQSTYQLLFLSSVAASIGRGKNSLYGGTKAAIELYLSGLQQIAPANQVITLARLGFIDTRATYGLSGVFYAASPKTCAWACLQALKKKKRLIYFPFFWRYLMAFIKLLPFRVFKRLKH